jgi:outer membrane protein assembly factor BamA
LNARIQLWDRSTPEQRRRVEALVGFNTTYNIVNPYPGSLLEQDIAAKQQDTADGRTLANLLRGTDPHALLVINLGALFDTRDHEYTPTRGTFTEISVRSSPGVQQDLRYAAVTVNSAWYHAIVGERLSVAFRGVADVIPATPPSTSSPASAPSCPATAPAAAGRCAASPASATPARSS